MRLKEFERFALAYAPGKAMIDSKGATIKNLSKAAEGRAAFVQLIALKPVASEAQLWQAADQTVNAFLEKANFVNQPGLEFLLRVSGRKQLPQALDLLEVKEGLNDCLLVACAESPARARNTFLQASKLLSFMEEPGLLAGSAKKNKAFLMKTYGLTPEALKVCPLEELVLETIALVALES